MPSRRVVLRADDVQLNASLASIRRELQIDDRFDDAAQAEADAAVRRGPRPPPPTAREFADRRDVELVTIDPEGSRDLDQAYAAQRRGEGYRVLYAIADVASFVAPGGALDSTARAPWRDDVRTRRTSPFASRPINEGAASLLAGHDRQALLWTIDLDADGSATQHTSSALGCAAASSSRTLRLSSSSTPTRPTSHCTASKNRTASYWTRADRGAGEPQHPHAGRRAPTTATSWNTSSPYRSRNGMRRSRS